MTSIIFIEKEQDWQNETTRYWFSVNGVEFCVAECGPASDILDRNGKPLLEGERKAQLRRQFVVTDSMRA